MSDSVLDYMFGPVGAKMAAVFFIMLLHGGVLGPIQLRSLMTDTLASEFNQTTAEITRIGYTSTGIFMFSGTILAIPTFTMMAMNKKPAEDGYYRATALFSAMLWFFGTFGAQYAPSYMVLYTLLSVMESLGAGLLYWITIPLPYLYFKENPSQVALAYMVVSMGPPVYEIAFAFFNRWMLNDAVLGWKGLMNVVAASGVFLIFLPLLVIPSPSKGATSTGRPGFFGRGATKRGDSEDVSRSSRSYSAIPDSGNNGTPSFRAASDAGSKGKDAFLEYPKLSFFGLLVAALGVVTMIYVPYNQMPVYLTEQGNANGTHTYAHVSIGSGHILGRLLAGLIVWMYVERFPRVEMALAVFASAWNAIVLFVWTFLLTQVDSYALAMSVSVFVGVGNGILWYTFFVLVITKWNFDRQAKLGLLSLSLSTGYAVALILFVMVADTTYSRALTASVASLITFTGSFVSLMLKPPPPVKAE